MTDQERLNQRRKESCDNIFILQNTVSGYFVGTCSSYINQNGRFGWFETVIDISRGNSQVEDVYRPLHTFARRPANTWRM